MTFLLDTNAWLRWFHRPQELSATVRQLLNAEQTVALSPISILEVAQKHHKGKLKLPRPLDIWVHESMPKQRFTGNLRVRVEFDQNDCDDFEPSARKAHGDEIRKSNEEVANLLKAKQDNGCK